ncbi:MAG: hypothetical protein R2844_08380 [Caldilineales bacterium]
MLDYLIEEVLNQQAAEVQAFLLQTAILDRLTGSLCNALTGQNDGQATLEMLEHANLFIVPLDETRHWYRYHHLFAELLRQRLHETRQGRASVLHQRAKSGTNKTVRRCIHRACLVCLEDSCRRRD